MMTTQDFREPRIGPMRVRLVREGGIYCYVKLAANMIRLEWFGHMVNGVWYLTRWDWSVAKDKAGSIA
jgi:hypothetical protein